MFAAFTFGYLAFATAFYAFVLKKSQAIPEPASERTHPLKPAAEIVELFPNGAPAEERKAA